MHPRLQSKLALAATILISLGGSSAAVAKPCPTLPIPGAMPFPGAAPVFGTMPPFPMPPFGMPMPHPGMLMTAVDANGDGDIARTEATAFHDRVFEQLDTNRDGTITRQEIAERMAACPLMKTPEFE